ncbi:HAE1 family hydrophobic/amphiphilic exporter-1 [Caldalkalibacillus uzonensis]|uniref:HAE1 family hydrophobic/amphiphilic exporter-1 n=1 Tax=Caldalkalibacillus uzonensis TaxID=353224 RepID=A0ABU0CXK9_9BACI|nr:efflux RND transporter permease subunit [Caldalkalibacillus uzonensis]MDQ0340695.1 HAE1 family hydrophobic/amphiphilic exporter-1 [Caldalkalibacillus uzonensis]
MNWLSVLIKRKIIVGLFLALILVVGGYAVTKLNVELMPDVTFDAAIVNVYAGEKPVLDMEEQITNPLEEQIASLQHVDSFTSTTSIGQTSITVMFEEGKGDEAFPELEAVVNRLKGEVPDVDEVYAFQFSMNSPFDYFLDLYGGSLDEMTVFAHDVLKPRLEALPEVREVQLLGTVQEEIVITLHEQRMRDYQVDAQQIIQLIPQEDQNVSLGEIDKDGQQVTLRWDTKLKTIEDLKKLPVPTAEGIIELDDMADIKIEQPEVIAAAWKNGDPNYISVQVGRSTQATDIDLSEAVRAEVQKMKEEGLINGFQLEELASKGEFIRSSIEDVTRNVLIGGVLAIAIVLLFLRHVRTTLIIGIAIPSSILLTFASMWFLDYSINMLTLIGLGLGIGMMVDAAIVILESIYRKLQEGFPRLQAVVEGTKEVATAVLASMLTTVVVFVPIGIMSGELGKIIVILSVVIVVTLLSSVLISFTVIPVLAHQWIKLKKNSTHSRESRLLNRYGTFIHWMAQKKRRRWSVVCLFFFVFVGSLFLLTQVPTTVMPDVYDRQAELLITLERGTTPAEQREIAEQLHLKMQKIDEVKDYMVVIFSSDMMYMFVNMTPEEEAVRAQDEINQDILQAIESLQEQYPIEASSTMGFAGMDAYPVQVKIKGHDLDQLLALSENIMNKLEQIEGLTEIQHSLGKMVEEQQMMIDEEKVTESGLLPSALRQQIQMAMSKQPIGHMYVNGTYLPIMLTNDQDINTAQDLEKMKIMTSLGEKAVGDFIQLEQISVPVEIDHDNGDRVVTVLANYEGEDLGSINRQVQAAIQELERPTGYSIELGGQLSQQMEAFTELLYIFLIALFLVYLVMAIQFNSLIHPVVVMSIIPLTLTGVILGLFITQQELSVMSGMGIVMLAGIVLNNAILLIDRTKQLRQQNMERGAALAEAGKNRMRPIFMTTLTTVAGMLPLALATGSSSAYQAPMATVVISGLLFATLITLILIPAVYMIAEDIIGWPKRWLAKRRTSGESVSS